MAATQSHARRSIADENVGATTGAARGSIADEDVGPQQEQHAEPMQARTSGPPQEEHADPPLPTRRRQYKRTLPHSSKRQHSLEYGKMQASRAEVEPKKAKNAAAIY